MNIDKVQLNKLKTSIQSNKDDDYVIGLLDQFDIDIDIEGGTPLNHAVNYERTKLVDYLIKKGANVNALYDGDYTPLMSAIDRKNIELINILLKNGADINKVDKFGNTAIMKAVNTFDLELVKLLVNEGAKPFEGQNKQNYSAYDAAKDMGMEEIVKYFDSIK